MTRLQEAAIRGGEAFYYLHLYAHSLDTNGDVPAWESLSGLERTTWIDKAQRLLSECAGTSPKVIGSITPSAPWGEWRGDVA